MNKTVAKIKEYLRPGKPLVILGPYGCGKFECLSQAIQAAGLKRYPCRISYAEYTALGLRKWAKSIPGNGVLAIDEIDRANPVEIDFILEQARHPDRIMVLVGRSLPTELSYQGLNVISFVGEYPYELKE
jgi:hypothetical protein